MADQPPSPTSPAYVGQRGFTSDTSDVNGLDFIIRQIMGRMATITPMLVLSVQPGSGLVAGTVSIQPMVAQIDGQGSATPHGEIFNVPYFRLQGGANACILDPAVGDIGIGLICARDISSVKAAKAPANPGSRRQYDWADAVYLGGFLNGAPTQFVQFLAGGGINITAMGDLTLTAPTINLDGTLMINGDAYLAHEHSGVTTGSGNSGGVV